MLLSSCGVWSRAKHVAAGHCRSPGPEHHHCCVLLQAIEHHVECLRLWTYEQLQQLQHSNGTPMIRLFGKHECGSQHQSGIFQFQVTSC